MILPYNKNRSKEPNLFVSFPYDDMHSPYFEEFVQLMLQHGVVTQILKKKFWSDIPLLARLAPFHDYGKALIPDRIVNSSEKLNDIDKGFMQAHTVLGATVLTLTIPHLQGTDVYNYIWEICQYHHERIDGNGYPDGLKGDEIPSYVQIISLADAYDALRTPRPYRTALSDEEAKMLIFSGKCGAFSQVLLDNFMDNLGVFWALAQETQEIESGTDNI